MKNKKIIWTFLDDYMQQAFYDLQAKLSEDGKAKLEKEVLSKINQKGKPVVGIMEVKLEDKQFVIIGTFGQVSLPNTLLK